MKCPNCQERTVDAWERFHTYETVKGDKHLAIDLSAGIDPDTRRVSLDWMQCANEDCAELVVRMNESYTAFEGVLPRC